MSSVRVIHFRAENLKRLEVVEFSPDRNMVVVAGRNEQGKSSVLDAVMIALGGKKVMPPEPVRRGAEEAKIKLDLGDFVVERRITAAGGDRLTIRSREGLRFGSPQTMLDKLLEGISFDPEEWLRRKPKDQRDELLKISEVGISIDSNRAERAQRYNARTEAGRDQRRVQGALADLGELPPIPEARNIKVVFEEYQRAEKAHQDADNLKSLTKNWEDRAAEMEESLAKYLAQVEQEVTQRKDAIRRAKAEAAGLKKREVADLPDLKALREEFEKAREAVNARTKHEQAKRLGEELDTYNGEVARLTKEIDGLDEELDKALKAAKFPVEGLSVGDDDVLYKGIPLTQAAQSVKLRVAMSVAMRLQERKEQQLRIVQIREGALFDADALKLIAEMAEKHDFQVWLEKIAPDGASLLIEDGKATVIQDANGPTVDAMAQEAEGE